MNICFLRYLYIQKDVSVNMQTLPIMCRDLLSYSHSALLNMGRFLSHSLYIMVPIVQGERDVPGFKYVKKGDRSGPLFVSLFHAWDF